MIRLAIARLSQRQLLLAIFSVFLWSGMIRAADIFVTTTDDSGEGSLREALTQATAGDRIVFDISGTSTITLLSDLPEVALDISFANINSSDVTIDRNGNGPLRFTGPSADPTVLVIMGGAAPDIVAASTTTVYGDGAVSGDLLVPGTIAPGANTTIGTIGTLEVTGNLDLSNSQVKLDVSTIGGTSSNDLITVSGTATVTGATLAPSFIGNHFAVGQTYLVLESTSPIVGDFVNQGEIFALPNHPFLQATTNSTLGTDDFGFEITDNGGLFSDLVSGCNQTSAATLLDQLTGSGAPVVGAIRNGSADQVSLAINQLSGSIYPSLIGAEISHIQFNLETVRDSVVSDAISLNHRTSRWARGYGMFRNVDQDACQTIGYEHNVGGVELGWGLTNNAGLTTHAFAHLAGGYLSLVDIDQRAEIDSYRIGGSIVYTAGEIYVLGSAGAGIQSYDVRRSLSAVEESSFAESSFDGLSQFGYFELAYTAPWTPYIAMHATRVDLDSIAETGDAFFSLINDGVDGSSLRGVLGVSLASPRPAPLGKAANRLRFGWLHEYLDDSETIVSQIAGGGVSTGSLVDRGVELGRDWAFVRMQSEVQTSPGLRFMIAYHAYFNGDSSFNSLLGGASWSF